MKPENTLTPRQLAVVRALSSGASNPAIAKELKISLGSVKNYIHVACDKIGADNRVMLARWYWERYASGASVKVPQHP